jgi:hypothetical protein
VPSIRMTMVSAALACLTTSAFAQQAALPLKRPAQPTRPEISAEDLMSRLYVFSDDSMQGRQTGTDGHRKGTDYIAAEAQRMGLRPVGDDGTFFQAVPVFQRALDPASTIAAGSTTLKAMVDFVATPGQADPRSLDGVSAIYGGVQGDTTSPLTPDQVRGRLVIFTAPADAGGRGGRGGRGGPPAGFAGRGGRGGGAPNLLAEAAGIAVIVGDKLTDQALQGANPRQGQAMFYRDPAAPTSAIAQAPQAPVLTLQVTAKAAEALLQMPATREMKGMAGPGYIRSALKFREKNVGARNVVGVVEGSDPALRAEYVAIGGHSDHTGFTPGGAVDHDSLHTYNAARYAIVGMVARGQQQTDEQRAKVAAITVNLDSIRKARPARADSIRNGADDDGSGTVSVLEIAEYFAKMPQAKRPKRSLLFVWHVGEENGLWGSRYVTDHSPVPRENIVAQLNMDMVGRGEASDLPVGNPDYVQLVGSHRLSTELGDLVEKLNKDQRRPLKFDYQFDAPGHPENIYCRSDHYNYARYGIPITFFTTGLHGDYHQVTDEPQYIAYEHLARIGRLVASVATSVGNQAKRPVVDGVKPDPTQACTNNGAAIRP